MVIHAGSPSSSCIYTSADDSPLSIDSLEEAEVGVKIHESGTITSLLPAINDTNIDARPINASSQVMCIKPEETPAKKVRIGMSVPTTTPFLLMQKMLRGETDLHLTSGILLNLKTRLRTTTTF